MFSQAIAGQILNSNMPSLFPLAYYKNAIIILTRKLRFRIFITSTALIVFATLLIFTHWILDRSDRNSSRITRSRTLVSFSLFSDPKTVENKNFLRQDDSGAGARPPLNILALGGSQTWGARLQNRYDAYPWLIGQPFPDHVDNLATRATGADYPSVCLESMIPRNHIEGQPVYDLIMVEFVMNGTDGLMLLLKRLRDRYPDSVIVYVGLWSLISTAMEEGTKANVQDRGKDPSVHWVWKEGDFFTRSTNPTWDCFREVCSVQRMKEIVQDVGGYFYEFPRPNSPRDAINEGWFGDDWHHFSENGHRLIADDLKRFLVDKHHELYKPAKRFNIETLGDQCYNWFESGTVALPKYDGLTLKNLAGAINNDGNTDYDNNKWVLEVDPRNGATIQFESKFEAAPVGLGYMSRQDPAEYPNVEIELNNAAPVTLDPNVNRVVWMKKAHITTFSQIGLTKVGSNVMFLKPLEQRNQPFRVVGIYICGYCTKDGDMGGNFLARVEKVDGNTGTDRGKKENNSNTASFGVVIESIGDKISTASESKLKSTEDPKDAYYGVINNRYRPENDVDITALLPRETLPPLIKPSGDMSNVDDVAVQFSLERNFLY